MARYYTNGIKSGEVFIEEEFQNLRNKTTRKYIEEESKSTYTTFVYLFSFPNGFNVVLYWSTFLQQIQHLFAPPERGASYSQSFSFLK